eukprot:5791832-Amphidinium_carterae.4
MEGMGRRWALHGYRITRRSVVPQQQHQSTPRHHVHLCHTPHHFSTPQGSNPSMSIRSTEWTPQRY